MPSQRAIRVAVSPVSITRGDEFDVIVENVPGKHRAKTMAIDFRTVSPTQTGWVMGTQVNIVKTGRRLTATVGQTKDLPPRGILEIHQLQLRASQQSAESILTLIGGRDFPRAFLETRRKNDSARSIEQITLAAYGIEEGRRVDFARPMRADKSPRGATFEVVSFVKRCLITERLSLPGVDVIPLRAGNPALDDLELVNNVLAEFGWERDFEPAAWAQLHSRQNPTLVFRYPRVVARDAKAAVAFTLAHRDRLLDLLALHRGAFGDAIATAARNLAGGEWHFQAESPGYPGNVLGGFLSGEDPTALIAHIGAMQREPVVYFFVSLYREAQAARHADLAFFRYWSLLEAIARVRVTGSQPVNHFSGSAIRDGKGKPITTDHSAAGRVHELLRAWMVRADFAPSAFSAQEGETLWETVSVWYGYRNATAHHGGFREDDPIQKRQPWFVAVRAARRFAESKNPGQMPRDVQHDPYLSSLSRAAQCMVQSELSRNSRNYRLSR